MTHCQGLWQRVVNSRMPEVARKPYQTDNYSDYSLEPLSTPHRRRVESTLLVELRRHPRFASRFPARALNARGEGVDVLVTNISLSGLRLEGDLALIQTLWPGLERLNDHVPVELQVAFVLPASEGRPVSVRAHCRTAYARAEGEASYQIGMMITAFDEGRDAYTAYIQNRQADS